MPVRKIKTADKATGTYRYDKKLKRVVKISGDIPGLNKYSKSCCDNGGCQSGDCAAPEPGAGCCCGGCARRAE